MGWYIEYNDNDYIIMNVYYYYSLLSLFMTFWFTEFLPLTSAPLLLVAMEDVDVDGWRLRIFSY